jgi:hypothetical protein
MNQYRTFATLLLVAMLASSCAGLVDQQSAITTAIFQTQQISELQTAAAANQGGQPIAGGDATATPTPDAAQPSATVEIGSANLAAVVSVSVETNCRSGPSTAFPALTTILVGEEVQVLATSPLADYVIVLRPGGSGSCWLWLRYASQTDFSSFGLPVATLPPTATPTFTPTPSQTTVSFDWSGSWQYTITQSNGNVASSGTITFAISGSGATTTITFIGVSTDLTGTISSNGQSLSGTWSNNGGPGDSGTFQIQIKSGNTNQFQGTFVSVNFPAVNTFCGWRSGSNPPC